MNNKDIKEKLNKKGLSIRLPVSNKPNVRHKSKKHYNRNKDKETLIKELNEAKNEW